MMGASIYAEVRKLKGSWVMLLGLASPTVVAAFLGLLCLRHRQMTWTDAMEGTTGLWSFFILPLAVTALTMLTAQIEHGPRAWDHVRALPVPRCRLFAAKALVIMAIVGLMSCLLAAEIRLVGWLLRIFAARGLPTGAFPWMLSARLLAGMWAASFCLAMVQLWVSLRFASFVPGLALGVAGTFLAVMASGLPEGVYVPWMMPLNILSQNAGRPEQALVFGVAGGATVMALMLAHLSWREM